MNELQRTAFLALDIAYSSSENKLMSPESSSRIPAVNLEKGLAFLSIGTDHGDINKVNTENHHPFDKSAIVLIESNEVTKEIASTERTVFFLKPPQNLAPRLNETFVHSGSKGAESEATPKTSDKTLELPMQYGCLTNSTASHAAHMLEKVLLPLLLQNTRSNSTVTSSLLESHFRKFAASVCGASKQMEEGARLPIPSIVTADIDSIVDDGDAIQILEHTVEGWYDVVARKIEEELRKQPEGRGPLAEVEFWRHRHAVLSNLEEQIQRPIAQQILKKVRMVGNAVVNPVDDQLYELSRLAVEAADNAKFLSTLERHFRTLVEGSVDTVVNSIPQLMDSLRMVWTVSRHYNRDERFVPLMERISHQLSVKVRHSVDVKSILRCPSNTTILLEAASLLDTWRVTYIQVRKQIEDEGLGHRRWEFDRNRLFDQIDYMANVCRDLHEVAKTLDQFQRFLGPEVSAIIGQNGDIDAIELHVNLIPDLVERVQFDVFDKRQEDNWKSTMKSVAEKVNETDHAAGVCIESAFQTLRSAEAAFSLVENFRNLQSRPEIHRRIEERYTDILEHYSRELAAIERIFQSRKANPPICKTYPPTAGAIAWSLDLYQRAKRPILRFKSHEGMLTSSYGNIVKHKYLSFARSIDSFKDSLFTEWEKSVAWTVAEGLKRYLITESDYVWPPDDKTFSVRLLRPNFPPDIKRMIHEAKHLSGLGFQIPDAALTVTLQEDTFQR